MFLCRKLGLIPIKIRFLCCSKVWPKTMGCVVQGISLKVASRDFLNFLLLKEK